MFTRALLALLALLPSIASATPAPGRATATLGGPSFEGALQAHVTGGEVALRCTDALVCAVEATWEVAVDPDDPEGPGERWLVGRIPATYLTITGVTCCREDGRCEGCAERVDAAGSRTPWQAADVPSLPVLRFQAAARAGERIRVTLRGEMAPPPNRAWTSWALTPVKTRHPLLSSDDQATMWRIVLDPPLSRTEGALITASAQVPEEMGVDGEGFTFDDGRGSATLGAAPVELRATRAAPVLVNGGPLLGVGARVNAEPAVRMRLGYEIAAPAWLLYALAVETDFADRALVVPTVEAALPFVLLLPSVGLAVGAPVHFDGDGARVGVRIQASLAFPFVSVVIPVDLYPGLDTRDPEFWHLAVMLQASL